ncbi:2-oxoglutarate dehydrogenase E1 component [Deinococcus soli (ex Cha et al. 2016)]|uniref:2-oxoglutarate dehydrogenase E1 component n=2 Tax=Deinococcus soli (ex Cha et al. 2016) TaxID=1309411 RepID=A0ACC6KI56_9DEIO|nr:2-oxoglutarate dehydrogenase E1 component [Deinococcus soli (ex Cha et al. 2016)]MDR6219247.1 2-oxoglutarate dehydrogenase E1 component [Deinococcus soli (ex Cha et al. 2016)]MDR6329496.1 2-oxoglutarate dehydrogenase E1 component [Deinococcus soli (ex Cha et al. 2016)]MDR6752156.1 2-oxoglutarate dehydrogenase E1 component [Deinococcus soli (ex Cha et al. 2016)]
MTQSQTIMSGGNAAFIEGLYEAYLADPQSVDPQWRAYFDELRGGAHETPHSAIQQAFYQLGTQRRGGAVVPAPQGVSGAQQAAGALITAFRVYGHISAHTNPLKMRGLPVVPELTPEYYGLSAADLNEQVQDGPFSGPLRDVIAQLQDTYCGPIGFEFNYLPANERAWFQERVEANRGRGVFSRDERRRLMSKLNAAEGLELYLKNKYPGVKRFGLEGGESFIPLLDRIIQQAGAVGVKEVVLGMAHRGRLNTLVNIFGKPSSVLFDEFDGKKKLSDNPDVAGDVKYHMGYSSDVRTPGGPMHLALAFNPSHLEIVSPVVHGSVRARQDRRGDEARRSVLPITVHGDAAVSGQGVVMETLNLSRLRGFATGGAVRIVINNQVGFTISDPRDTRSSRYCTDVAKIANAPVLHVNGDDPEAVAFCGDLALAYRQEFGKDVFIDLICFRRNGHNEGDEPRMTQPIMYREIDQHPGTRALYAKKLEAEGVLAAGEGEALVNRFRDQLDAGEAVVEEMENAAQSKLAVDWSGYTGTHWRDEVSTAVPQEKLTALGLQLTEVPEGFKVHRTIERTVIKPRQAMAKGEQPLDWGMGEMLAYATLLEEGFGVRLVGQDSGRGTFVHRHAVLHDQNAQDPMNEEYMALAHLSGDQGRVEVIDSTLSEEAVMAFEYGYSTSEPKALIAWEAQFGDFANGAQAVIDQFLSAGESKWQRLSGLTLLLPHGYEGAGPEHSSARLERYLQLCAQKNMQVVVPSSAAQIFHLLRRQVLRPYRKPLIVMTPKSLLRNKAAMSPLSDLTDGRFCEVIGDPEVTGARRVVISSGKLHWELVDARDADREGYAGTALIRLEQLYPFPAEALAAELARHPGAQVVWAQEEPENQGAWLMIWEDLEKVLAPGQTLKGATRPRSASTAAGYASVHAKEQAKVIADALGEKLSGEVVAEQKELAETAKQQG